MAEAKMCDRCGKFSKVPRKGESIRELSHWMSLGSNQCADPAGYDAFAPTLLCEQCSEAFQVFMGKEGK